MHKVLLEVKARVASVVTVGGYPDLGLYWYKLFSGVVVIARPLQALLLTLLGICISITISKKLRLNLGVV